MHALPVLISCERGLGRLTESACAKRWLIDHGKIAVERGGSAADIKHSPCGRECPEGQARAGAPNAPTGLAQRVCGACRKPLPAGSHGRTRYHAECRPSTYKPKRQLAPQH